MAALQRRVGVCSWSLRPGSPAELAAAATAVGVSCVQLALDPLRRGAWDPDETAGTLARAGITIPSGMMAMAGEDYATLDSIRRTGGVRPDERWEENLSAAIANAGLARRLGIPLVTFHAGFIPEDGNDPLRQGMVARLRAVTDAFAYEGVHVAFETGQETARTLLGILAEIDRPTAGVNFDPANMILYGMGDPVAALRALAPRIVQLHIKDGVASRVAGEWGREVPVGEGEVAWDDFFRVLGETPVAGDLMIEREAGEERARDIRRALGLVERHLR